MNKLKYYIMLFGIVIANARYLVEDNYKNFSLFMGYIGVVMVGFALMRCMRKWHKEGFFRY